MTKKTRQACKSRLRERQASKTRERIVEARGTRERPSTPLRVARRSRYGLSFEVFGSKTGILRELLNQVTFGPDYEDEVEQTMSEPDPEVRLRRAAGIARKIHDAQAATFDRLRGAGVVAQELASLEQEREGIRYERQEQMVVSLREAGRLLLDPGTRPSRDVFWTLTGVGMSTGCWCESAGGVPRNTRIGWRRCW
jgi:hypothetical protein